MHAAHPNPSASASGSGLNYVTSAALTSQEIYETIRVNGQLDADQQQFITVFVNLSQLSDLGGVREYSRITYDGIGRLSLQVLILISGRL